MNLGAIFVGLALLVLVIPYVIDPFRPRRRQWFIRTQPVKTGTELSPENPLLALRDLEFDYQTEKITEEDYQSIRAMLLTKAADAVEAQQREDARLEGLIQARRTKKTNKPDCTQCGRALRDGDKFCPECGLACTIQCPDCAHQNQAEDKFCSQCGCSLEVLVQ